MILLNELETFENYSSLFFFSYLVVEYMSESSQLKDMLRRFMFT